MCSFRRRAASISTLRGLILELCGLNLALHWLSSMLRGLSSALRGLMSALRWLILALRGLSSTLRGLISALCKLILAMRGLISTLHGPSSALRRLSSALLGLLALREVILALRGLSLALRGLLFLRCAGSCSCAGSFSGVVRAHVFELCGLIFWRCELTVEQHGFMPFPIAPAQHTPNTKPQPHPGIESPSRRARSRPGLGRQWLLKPSYMEARFGAPRREFVFIFSGRQIFLYRFTHYGEGREGVRGILTKLIVAAISGAVQPPNLACDWQLSWW